MSLSPLKPGSNRAFGAFFCAACMCIAGWRFWRGETYLIFVGLAALFALFALFLPQALAPLNGLWFRFGLLLHRIVQPIVLCLLFFGVLTPYALLARLLGKTVFDAKTKPKVTDLLDSAFRPTPVFHEKSILRRAYEHFKGVWSFSLDKKEVLAHPDHAFFSPVWCAVVFRPR